MMNEKHNCPCCGYKTFPREPIGTFDICEVCFWEDDPIQLEDINYEGGANEVSLLQAQINFAKFGACEERFVKEIRRPTKEEARDEGWMPFPDIQ